MDVSARPTPFKFRFVVDGHTQGFLRSTQGLVDTDHLVLADTRVPYEVVGDTLTRGNRLLVQLLGVPEGEAARHMRDGVLVLEPKGIRAEALETLIDRRVARRLLEARRREAAEKGESHLVRAERCPTCEADLDLTPWASGRYVYCRFCDTIAESGRATLGRAYRTCDECGFFGRIQEYPEFFFYFVILFYGFSYRKRFLCTSCANRLFRTALLKNSIFILGVPTALWVKVKSMLGRDPSMAELHAATELARKGRLRDAAPIFDSIRRRFPEHPGLLLNEGVAHIQNGDRASGEQLLRRAQASCPNYLPVLRLLSAS